MLPTFPCAKDNSSDIVWIYTKPFGPRKRLLSVYASQPAQINGETDAGLSPSGSKETPGNGFTSNTHKPPL